MFYAKGVSILNLAEQLRRSVLFYNGQLSENSIQILSNQIENEEVKKTNIKKVFKCPTCFSIYDNSFGDELANIPAGITFENLPENYKCGICEEPKLNFIKIEVLENVI